MGRILTKTSSLWGLRGLTPQPHLLQVARPQSECYAADEWRSMDGEAGVEGMRVYSGSPKALREMSRES